nr:MAG TPA: ERF superfamily protein [Caudoviricetes sp.]
MSIIEKLQLIQQELIAPKNQYNSFGKYNYRSCEDILEGLKPCLKKVKAAVTVSDTIEMVGNRYYVKATATLFDSESNESVSNTAYAREDDSKKGMDASQITGSTSSYARKYALNGLFCIDDVKDADSRDNRQKEAEKQHKEEKEMKDAENMMISAIKVQALAARCEKDKVDIGKILMLYKVNRLEDLTEKKYSHINIHWEDIKKA